MTTGRSVTPSTKLSLNDASLFFPAGKLPPHWASASVVASSACCAEIIQERLEREYDLDLITTAPTVVYEIELNNGETIPIDSPAAMPPVNNIKEMREPSLKVQHLAAAGAWAT